MLILSCLLASCVGQQYSKKCADSLSSMNANVQFTNARDGWRKSNEQCLAAAGRLPTKVGHYIVNCSASLEAFQASCYNLNAFFCVNYAVLFMLNTSAYYEYYDWESSCVPLECLNTDDKNQICADMQNGTRSIFTQCSADSCSYGYDCGDCSAPPPILPTGTPTPPPRSSDDWHKWKIVSVSLGSALGVALVLIVIIVMRKRYAYARIN
jgi:hypothetical protein